MTCGEVSVSSFLESGVVFILSLVPQSIKDELFSLEVACGL